MKISVTQISKKGYFLLIVNSGWNYAPAPITKSKNICTKTQVIKIQKKKNGAKCLIFNISSGKNLPLEEIILFNSNAPSASTTISLLSVIKIATKSRKYF